MPPVNESQRLAALLAYDVLDTDPEQAYDDLTHIAAQICGTPIALVSLVDSERQWFKSRHGLEATETPRDLAFCAHAILDPNQVLVIPDSSQDERFHDNPLVTGAPHVRSYAGAPLVDPSGHALGTLCVIDHKPRELTPEQLEALSALSRQTVHQLELRKSVTSLRELAAQVEHANKELKDFTSIAAHDLREPLRKIVSFGGLLERDLGEEISDRAREDLLHMTDAAQHMDRLITSLLDLSQAGSGERDDEEIDLGDCAHLALDALRTRIEERNAQVEMDPLPVVTGDMVLLTQIFQNLIGNAIKFTEEQPQVHITCAEVDGECVVGVRDQGIGMDPSHAERVFAPFKRLHGRTEYEGTGIGLSIVRKIVERHGGRVWAESKPGEGAHLRFTLAGMKFPEPAAQAA